MLAAFLAFLVSPVCTGMIRRFSFLRFTAKCFPRACGDDPDIRAILAQQTAFPRVCGDDPELPATGNTSVAFPPCVRG